MTINTISSPTFNYAMGQTNSGGPQQATISKTQQQPIIPEAKHSDNGASVSSNSSDKKSDVDVNV